MRNSAQLRPAASLAHFQYPTARRRKNGQNIAARFGHRVFTLRLDRDMTQAEMAKAFGINRSFISDVERGAVIPSLAMVEVFALGLKVSLSELFQGL